MRKTMWLVSFLAVSALACATASPPPGASAPAAAPTLDGRPIWDGPFDDERAARVWQEAQALLANRPPARDPATAERWQEETFTPWMKDYGRRLDALKPDIRELGQGDPEARLFASVVYASVFEHFIAEMRAAPPPPMIERAGPDYVAEYRAGIDDALATAAEHVRLQYDACATAAAAAAPPLRGWVDECRAREAKIAPLAARAKAMSEPPADQVE